MLAGGTIWLAAHDWPIDGLPLDLAGAAFALWVVGWLFGPVIFGGGDETLRPEHLSLLPIRPARLAAGLLATAFVGVTPVVSLVPMTDPQKRSGNLLENGTDFTQVLLVLVLVAAACAPAYLTVRYGSPWLGAPVGVATGVLLAWLLGDLAGKRLEATGTRMLGTMKTAVARKQAATVDWGSLGGIDLGDRRLGIAGASPARKALVFASLTVCWIPLVAQGLVPIYLRQADPERRSWFLARHVPEAWEWPTIAVMVVLGLALLAAGLTQLARARSESTPPQSDVYVR